MRGWELDLACVPRLDAEVLRVRRMWVNAVSANSEKPTTTKPSKPTWRRRLRLLLMISSIGLLLSFVGLELFLRACLFEDDMLPRAWCRRVNKASHFTSLHQDDRWKLQVLARPKEAVPNRTHDAHIGWRPQWVDAVTYTHTRVSSVGTRRSALLRRHGDSFTEVSDRRLVLLYGDSFAACTTPSEQCFQGLLEGSELGDRFALLNYGAGGYGVDQMYLLLERSIDQYVPADPIVVVAILVDGDLHRAMTGIRIWPKPRFRLEDGRLTLQLAEPKHPLDYIRRNPVSIRSYAWRYLVYGTNLLPEALRARLRRDATWRELEMALNRKLISEIQRSLEDRGVEYFFLLFDGREACDANGLYGWEEPFLHDTFEQLGIPFVSTRADILEDSRRTGRALDDYFAQELPNLGHYTALGNEAAFRALRSGLERRFEIAGEVLILDGQR